MPLETGTFISDLVITNPPGTDLKSQGDDHLQLIKKVVKNTFPNGSKAFYLPSSSPTITTTYNALATDMNKCLIANTGGGSFSIKMPALVSADDGWRVTIVKTGSPPLFIEPPSGNIMSGDVAVAKARRSRINTPFDVMWFGGSWWCERTIRDPIGVAIPFFGSSLPTGYEWPNGQVLASAAANYPEYHAIIGTTWPIGAGVAGGTPDLRERLLAGTDMTLGSPNLISNAAGRSGINPVLGATGGLDVVTLVRANLPNQTLGGSGSGSVSLGSHHHDASFDASSFAVGPGSQQLVTSVAGSGLTNAFATSDTNLGTPTVTVTSITTDSMNGNVVQTNVNKMPPTFCCNYLLVVE